MPGAARQETVWATGALGTIFGNPSVLSVGDHSIV
jgi:hypothetical protein